MQANCVFDAWDSKNSRYYPVGVVPDFDTTNSDLNSLLVPGGREYVFQYPGHVHPGKSSTVSIVDKEAAVSDRPKQSMSASHKQKMAEGRARRKSEKEARLAAV